jgi:predicted RNase H-like nuclease (RuvC/YqgF family)
MKKNITLMLAFMALGTPVIAQEAQTQRDLSLQFSRYDGIIGRLEAQNERLMQQVRELQRENSRVAKLVDSQQASIQESVDGLQQFRNTEVENIKQSFWGSGTRDCKDLGVKHQQIKVTLNPAGTESVRFLCFDGKPLLLGAERYAVGQ